MNIKLFFPLRSLIVPCGGDIPQSRASQCVMASLSAQDTLAPIRVTASFPFPISHHNMYHPLRENLVFLTHNL